MKDALTKRGKHAQIRQRHRMYDKAYQTKDRKTHTDEKGRQRI